MTIDRGSAIWHAAGIDLDLVVVGGAGHVGLPLSLAFASTGMRVGIYDTDRSALARIAHGEVPFAERGAPELLGGMLAADRLVFSSSPDMLGKTESVVVVIGTPIDEFLNPRLAAMREAIRDLAPYVRDGALVVLRSTVFPGTTAVVADAFADAGKTVDVAMCPERIVEGQALEELRHLPEIIGADTDRAAERAERLFTRLQPRTVRVSTREAELAKLLTNTWRYMKFAVANQFFMLAHQSGVDYTNVLRAIKEDYPRAADLPGPGFAAGPCLLKDTMQLAAFAQDHFPLGHSAMQINEGLPAYVVSVMEKRFHPLRGKRVGILGMAFKAESDDPRASLSYKLRRLLLWAGADVRCTDPYVRDEALVPLDEVLATSDILVLGVPHRAYRDLALDGEHLVDVWGASGAIRV
ncbi:MAG TPA: nucleotide sugar dehydrogenase [Candidatus Limnocylindria bacterium]|nr:nucleotide sugar dehydrogenase [Candidatus Limnocylindria bacterium]